MGRAAVLPCYTPKQCEQLFGSCLFLSVKLFVSFVEKGLEQSDELLNIANERQSCQDCVCVIELDFKLETLTQLLSCLR